MAKAKKDKAPVVQKEKKQRAPRVNKLKVLVWLQSHDHYIPQEFVERGIVPTVGEGEIKSSRKLWNDLDKLATTLQIGNVERIRRLRELYHPHQGRGKVVKSQAELFSAEDKFLTVNRNEITGDFIRIPHASLWYSNKHHKDKSETLWVHVRYTPDSIIITKADVESV